MLTILEQWMINNDIDYAEWFVVNNSYFHNMVVRITYDSKLQKFDNTWMLFSDEEYKLFLTSQLTVIKVRFYPKYGDEYYYVDFLDKGVNNRVWRETLSDVGLYFINNCFRTKEEAENNKEILMKIFMESYNRL